MHSTDSSSQTPDAAKNVVRRDPSLLKSNKSPGLDRRWILPIIILLVASVLWMIGRSGERQDAEQVRNFVRDICREVIAGRGVEGHLAASPAAVRAVLPEELNRILQPPLDEDLRALRVEVTPGDDPRRGDGTATHVATIYINQVPMLTMRIGHHRDRTRKVVLGYWVVGETSP